MYQLIIESFLGLKRNGNTLYIEPCLPAHWPSTSIHYQFGNTTYEITIIQGPQQENKILLDEVSQSGNSIVLKDDLVTHTVKLFIATGDAERTHLQPDKLYH